MKFPDELKKIRQKCLLSQAEFAESINVSFSTVNRWEGGKAKPNLNAMKSLREFCKKNDIDFSCLEKTWLTYNK